MYCYYIQNIVVVTEHWNLQADGLLEVKLSRKKYQSTKPNADNGLTEKKEEKKKGGKDNIPRRFSLLWREEITLPTIQSAHYL